MIRSKDAWSLGLIGVVALATGCHMYPNTLVDDLPASQRVSTVSARQVRSLHVEPAQTDRGFEPVVLDAQDGSVSHGPLWFEDPFEMVGSDDGRFAVTDEDVWCFPYGIARFIANVVLVPIKIILEPPTRIMCSDGRFRYAHHSGKPEPFDAQPCAGTMVPLDVQELRASEAALSDMDEGDAPPSPASDATGGSDYNTRLP